MNDVQLQDQKIHQELEAYPLTRGKKGFGSEKSLLYKGMGNVVYRVENTI